jgi:hypothetical protein
MLDLRRSQRDRFISSVDFTPITDIAARYSGGKDFLIAPDGFDASRFA